MAVTSLVIGAPNPVQNPELYERIKLAGQWSPGVAHVDPAPRRATGWDVQVPSGGSGGFTVKRRVPPIKFSIKFYLWLGDDELGGDVDHFAPWEDFKKLFVKPIKANQPKALAIYHPLLAGLNPPVTDVVIEDFNEPAPDGEGGAWAEVHFDEYRPFIRKPVAPLTGTTTGKTDPNAALKAEVAKATDEFNQT